jgi:predicted metal-dependent hydrolase
VYGRVGEILRKYGINDSGMNFTINDNEEPESIVNVLVNGASVEGVKKVFGSTINGVITLNKLTMQHASKEFIAATILHEMLHVLLKGIHRKNMIL